MHRTPAFQSVSRFLIALALAAGLGGASARAATVEQVDKMIDAGKAYLYSQQSKNGTWELVDMAEKDGKAQDPNGAQFGGRTAMCVYTLLAAGENDQDPKLVKAIEFLKTAKITGTYALGLRCQAMLFLPSSPEVKKVLKEDAAMLLSHMKLKEPATGFFDYDGRNGPMSTSFSLSRSQYGVLGIWAAAQMGIEIPTRYWDITEKAWLRAQEPDGGWRYIPGKDSPPVTPGITAVGVATLYIAQEYLNQESASRCRGNVDATAIDRGLKYMEVNSGKFATDTKYDRDFPYATLYAVERIGVSSGRKYFGAVDWFDKGADWLLKKQGKTGGFPSDLGGPVASTCWSLLFLSRGRAPIMMNKLEFTSEGAKQPDWNQRPRDVANLARWLGSTLERDINWQVVNLTAKSADLHDAPVLYMSGTETVKLADADVAKLREYAEGGGMILGHADCGGREFAASFRTLGSKVFPDYEFRELPENHPIYDAGFPRSKWKQKPSVLGLSNGVRELMILIPQADPGKAWQQQSSRTREELFELGGDIFLYAVDRKGLRYRGDTHWVEASPKVTPKTTVAVNRLKYTGNWDPEPGGWRRMAAIVHNANKATLTVTPVEPGKESIAAPVAHLTGTATFKLPAEARAAIKKYVDDGGTLVIDAAGGSSLFAAAAETELAAIFPGAVLDVLPADHAVYAANGKKMAAFTYRRMAREKLGRLDSPRVMGMKVGDKVRVFFSREDLSTGLVGNGVDGIIGYDPATSVDIMSNILAYAAKMPPATQPATQPAATQAGGATTKPVNKPKSTKKPAAPAAGAAQPADPLGGGTAPQPADPLK